MTRAQEVPAAIQWHEGMLLAPQHFQQLGARQERLLHYHVETVSPFHYGVRSLRLDLPCGPSRAGAAHPLLHPKGPRMLRSNMPIVTKLTHC